MFSEGGRRPVMAHLGIHDRPAVAASFWGSAVADRPCPVGRAVVAEPPERKRFGNPEVLALEAAIDKALSSAFGTARPHTCGTIRPRHSTPAPSLQMPRFVTPSCLRLVDQEDTMRRFKKRANIFPRASLGGYRTGASRRTKRRASIERRSALWFGTGVGNNALRELMPAKKDRHPPDSRHFSKPKN
jgi:hypothetical protein